jgi:hypothetical protein
MPILQPKRLLGLRLRSFVVHPSDPQLKLCKGWLAASFNRDNSVYLGLIEARNFEGACGNSGAAGAVSHPLIDHQRALLVDYCHNDPFGPDDFCRKSGLHYFLRWRQLGIEIDIDAAGLSKAQLFAFAQTMTAVRSCGC